MRPNHLFRTDKRSSKVLLALVCLLLFNAGTSAAQRPIRLHLPVAEPYSTPMRNGVVDLVLKEMFKRLHRDYMVMDLPDARALHMANEGHTDIEGLRVAGLEKDYPNLLMVPEPVHTATWSAFTCDKSVPITGWDSLRDYSVACMRGWAICDNNIPSDTDVVHVSTMEQLLKMLCKQRVDVIVLERYAARYYLKKLGLHCQALRETPLARQPTYMYVNKRLRELVPSISSVLRGMHNDGTIRRLVNQYGPK